MVARTTSTSEPVRMTLAEWADMPEDEPGEFVDGLLVEEEMPSYLHEFVVSWFVALLRGWAHARGGWVAGSGAKFAVSRSRGRMPDLTVYLRGARRPQLEG